MAGLFLYLGLALLIVGSLAHDEVDEFVSTSKPFVLPPNAFPTTTVSPPNDTESVTTDQLLNVSTTLGNSSETEVSSTTETTESTTDNATVTPASTEQMSKDLTRTDSSGCMVELKDELEEACMDKLQTTIVSMDSEDGKGLCCAFEDYEKCAMNGYRRSHCQIDQKELKNSLGSARIFIAAIADVNCAQHKAACASGCSTLYFNVLSIIPVLFASVKLFY